jgi:hypothetical protein
MSQANPTSHSPSEAHEHHPGPPPATGGEDQLTSWAKTHKGAIVGIVAGAVVAIWLYRRHAGGGSLFGGAPSAGGAGAGTSGEVTGGAGGLPPDSSLPPGTLYAGTLPPSSAASQPGGTTNIYVTGNPTGGTPAPPGWAPPPYPVAPTPPPSPSLLPPVKVEAHRKGGPKPTTTRTVRPVINPATGLGGVGRSHIFVPTPPPPRPRPPRLGVGRAFLMAPSGYNPPPPPPPTAVQGHTYLRPATGPARPRPATVHLQGRRSVNAVAHATVPARTRLAAR